MSTNPRRQGRREVLAILGDEVHTRALEQTGKQAGELDVEAHEVVLAVEVRKRVGRGDVAHAQHRAPPQLGEQGPPKTASTGRPRVARRFAVGASRLPTPWISAMRMQAITLTSVGLRKIVPTIRSVAARDDAGATGGAVVAGRPQASAPAGRAGARPAVDDVAAIGMTQGQPEEYVLAGRPRASAPAGPGLSRRRE